MKITSLKIQNFRGIENFKANNLDDFVVIAGSNGCGKSTVLDALRLVKSTYVANDFSRWFSEIGININRPHNFSKVFRNPKKPLKIKAQIELSKLEVNFLIENMANIVLAILINRDNKKADDTVTGDHPIMPQGLSRAKIASIRTEAEHETLNAVKSLKNGPKFIAGLEMTSDPTVIPIDSVVASAAFTCFRPDILGEIEFHSAHRTFTRENVSNIRLNVIDRSEEKRNRFLFDIENKYKNTKTRLGEEYVASVIKGEDPKDAPLQKSIMELFEQFIPGKQFLGIQIADNNSMIFPVVLETGEIHDIDELSSGEKEIVYGYLEMRTGTPKGSIILIDEPELHLNPALVQGLPAFYKTHLADSLNAQVWIVTHSDSILRQAVKAPNMAVYHMARANKTVKQQLVKIDNEDAVESAILDLVGDIAAYRPHAKIVLVEGNKDKRFDVEVIRRLFPDLAARGNFISAGNRRMTNGTRQRLNEILNETGVAGRVVSITDGDLTLEFTDEENEDNQFSWPVYEIENFLLEPSILSAALYTFLGKNPFNSEKEIIETLRKFAKEQVLELAGIQVQSILNAEFGKSINIRHTKTDPSNILCKSSESSKKRISEIDVTPERIDKMIAEYTERYKGYTVTKVFLKKFPGDRLIRALAGKFNLNGDHFRNACLDSAQSQKLCPKEMKSVLEQAVD